ncbi:hypothetical protein [Mesorhizobium xinjiangense]|uniref:hypothetical protein n=1 Tax=Mesorhizobium xinjiangense TaxID=2678685 RepID=UPI0012EDFA2C|nr:hypothetical protein [Mesorhizobium xinjiangense]
MTKNKKKPAISGSDHAETRNSDNRKDGTKKRKSPFHGRLHSEHPRDPFRESYSKNNLGFEF